MSEQRETGLTPRPPAGRQARRRAAGIYGTIITAAILDETGSRLPILPLLVAVILTLLVYWVAEQYAELLGDLHGGRLPGWREVREALAASWPMVSASYVPLLSVVLAWLLGASSSDAANVGLVVAAVVMVCYAWLAGRAAQVRGKRLVALASMAAGVGMMMILLKEVVIAHLH